jgi:hypothetical protein
VLRFFDDDRIGLDNNTIERSIRGIKLSRENARLLNPMGRLTPSPRKWMKEFGTDPVQAFPGHGQMKPEQLEIERFCLASARGRCLWNALEAGKMA